MSRHAKQRAGVQQGHSHSSSSTMHAHTQRQACIHLAVPDNQQPQTGPQGQVRRDVNVFHHLQREKKGVIIFAGELSWIHVLRR